MKRILVPTDFSEPSRQALGYALWLAAAVEGDVLLLHVVEKDPLCRYIVGEPAEPHPPWVDSSEPLLHWHRSPTIIYHDRCEEARWKLASLLPPGYPERFRPLVTVGKAGEEIARVAREEKVDVIILGVHGRQCWRHFVWPNVPAQILRQTAIPVLVFGAAGGGLLAQEWRREVAWRYALERDPWPELDDAGPSSCRQKIRRAPTESPPHTSRPEKLLGPLGR
jgi:nucleotide-binding universal stress UspA family protein